MNRNRTGRKKSYRRTALTAGALACAAVLACGCGSDSGNGSGGKKSSLNTAKPVYITVWNYYTGAQQESFNELVREFNETYGKEKGIVVEAFSEGSLGDLTESVAASADKEVGAEELPNIFSAYADTVYQMKERGIIEDISGYLSEEERAEFVDGYLEEGDLDNNGSLELFPIAKATEVFMINKTDWKTFADSCGLTEEDLSTIEKVTETAEKYYQWTDSQTPEPDDGKAFFGRDAFGNYMIIGTRQLGDDILSQDQEGKLVLSFPEETARKLWDNYYVPYIKGYFTALGRFRSDDVKTGDSLGYVGSSSSASFFPDKVIISDNEEHPIEASVYMAPRFADGEAYAVQQGAGMAVVKASDAEVEASVEFLKWFTEPEQNIRFALDSGYLPVKKEANDLDAIEKVVTGKNDITETLQAAIDTVNSCTMYTINDRDSSVRDILSYSMTDLAAADRSEIEAQIAAGGSAAEAVAAYDTDAHFAEWYQDISEKLEQAVARLNGEVSE